MSRKKLLDAKTIIERAKDALGLKTDTEFANHLGLKQSTISTWKSRNKVDLNIILASCNDISSDWLLYGHGDKHGGHLVDDLSHKILMMLDGMDEEEKRAVLKHLEKEKFISELMDERKEA